jgi:protocatechuate 3,4-dioxygenase beta subunit
MSTTSSDFVGRVLSRREATSLLGAAWLTAGLAARANAAAAEPPVCIVRPAQTEGPYFVDEALNRSDIRSDPASGRVAPGVPLALTFLISGLEGSRCRPLAGAQVDLWHCDVSGIYSDVRDPNFDTRGQKFLRGYQLTDESGAARFVTIYPGWYPGRAVHFHFKVRTPEAQRRFEFTSHLYFDDALTDRVHALEPYSARGQRTRRNDGDGIFSRGGRELMLRPRAVADGHEASFALALQLT